MQVDELNDSRTGGGFWGQRLQGAYHAAAPCWQGITGVFFMQVMRGKPGAAC